MQANRNLSPGKRTVASNSNTKGSPKKTATQNAGKVVKTKSPGKKPEKKVPRAKAGFELYPKESEDLGHGDASGGYCDYVPVKTLMEEQDSNSLLSVNASGSDANSGERQLSGNMDRTTVFNTRLVSSTPDPERLTEVDSVGHQAGPQQNQIQIKGTAEFCLEKENTSAVLPEFERKLIRQHLDGALMEEADAKKGQIQIENKSILNPEISSDEIGLIDHQGPEHTTVCASGTTVSNNSMGSNETLPLNQLPTGTSLSAFVQASKPPCITAYASTSCAVATTTCNSVRISERPYSKQATGGQIPKHSRANSTTPGLVHTTFSSLETGKRKQIKQPGNCKPSTSRSVHSDLKLVPENGATRNADAKCCIHDGGDISHAQAVQKKNVPRPLSASAVQMTHQASDEKQPISSAAHFSRNNSNLYNTGQLNTNQNRYTDSTNPQGSFESELHNRAQLLREALIGKLGVRVSLIGKAETECSIEQFESVMKMIKKENRKFILTTEGPRKLREITCRLEEYAAKKGDVHLRELVKQLNCTMMMLPQLLEYFNFEEMSSAFQKQSRWIKSLQGQLAVMFQKLKERTPSLPEDYMTEILHSDAMAARLNVENEILRLEISKLMAKNSEMTNLEERYKKMTEIYMQKEKKTKESYTQKERDLLLKLQQKEHEAIVSHQEHVEQKKRLLKEIEMMTLRRQGQEDRLSEAMRNLAIEESKVEEINRQRYRLQTELGEVKQALKDIKHIIDHAVETNTGIESIFAHPSAKVLLDLINDRQKDTSSSMAHSLLLLSGNKRAGILPTSGRSGNEVNPCHHTAPKYKKAADSSHGDWIPSSQEVCPPGETISTFVIRTRSFPKGTSGIREPLLTEEAQNTRSLPASSLTVAAVAAHNKQLGVTQRKGQSQSLQNWNGAKHQKTELANLSVSCSDPESMAVHAKHSTSISEKDNYIQQWSTDVESDRQQAAEVCHTSHHGVVRNMASNNIISGNKPDIVSEIENVRTLSEVPISHGKADNFSEMGSLQSLSEYPISEMNGWESVKEAKSSSEIEEAHCRVTVLDSKQIIPTSTSLQYASSAPASEDASLNEEKNSHPIFSPNSLTSSASTSTQRDYFHGTELDITLSTIPEDTQSSITSLTGISMSTIKSVDYRKFNKDLDNLDRNLERANQRLNEFRKKTL